MKRLALIPFLWLAAYAGAVEFTWQQEELSVEGDFLSLDELAEFRLYCDGGEEPVATFPGRNTTTGEHRFAWDTEHTCYMTAVHTDGDESMPSNTVTRREREAPVFVPPVLSGTSP